jgi:hypothetical protein
MVDEVGVEGRAFGAIQSPPDERDFQIEELYAGANLAAISLPSTYVVPNRPPVLNQGDTPMCVAYSTSSLKSYQDRDDQSPAKWWNFDEPYFFRLIGGGYNGAILRNAMDRMLKAGYPVVGGTSPTSKHKIKAYYSSARTRRRSRQPSKHMASWSWRCRGIARGSALRRLASITSCPDRITVLVATQSSSTAGMTTGGLSGSVTRGAPSGAQAGIVSCHMRTSGRFGKSGRHSTSERVGQIRELAHHQVGPVDRKQPSKSRDAVWPHADIFSGKEHYQPAGRERENLRVVFSSVRQG